MRYGVPSYVLHLIVQQDWSTTGLSRYLWDNAGLTSAFGLTAYWEAGAAPDTPASWASA